MPRGVRSHAVLLLGLVLAAIGLVLVAATAPARAAAPDGRADVTVQLVEVPPADDSPAEVVPIGADLEAPTERTGMWPEGAEWAGAGLVALGAAGVAWYFTMRTVALRGGAGAGARRD